MPNTPTGNELSFLRKLGHWTKTKCNPWGIGIPRTVLLQRYYNTLHLRKNWGEIDKDQVELYLWKATRGMKD